jgi:hypothetical protein
MSVSNAPEPPNVYFALGSISGRTFVSDAAASTVGWTVAAAGAGALELDGLDKLDELEELDELALERELLLPQPTARSAVTTARDPPQTFTFPDAMMPPPRLLARILAQ